VQVQGHGGCAIALQALAQHPLAEPGSKQQHPGIRGAVQLRQRSAWFANGTGGLSMTDCRGGFVDFLPYVYTDTALSRNAISWRVSDHYLLWAEFLL